VSSFVKTSSTLNKSSIISCKLLGLNAFAK
jgi:hypothetical protein